MSLYNKFAKNKQTGIIGSINWSSFCYSIHMLIEYDDKLVMGKTTGMPYNEMIENWDILDSLPEGYVIGKHNLPMTLEEKEVFDNQ